jgi:hypothetical protein
MSEMVFDLWAPTVEGCGFWTRKVWRGMVVERIVGATASLTDVFDRVLDRGIVINLAQRVAFSRLGIDLVAAQTRIVVTSIETFANGLEDLRPIPPETVPTFRLPSSAFDHRKRTRRTKGG